MASVPGPRLNAGSSSGSSGSHGSGTNHTPTCHPSEAIEATILFSIATAGILANLALIGLILLRKPVKKYRRAWSQGLILHQGVVDLARALLLVPLGVSVVLCQRSHRCSIIDTAFLLLVSVSTVNMLTTLINDAPIFPENEQLGSISAAVSGRLRNDHTWLDVSTQLKMNEGGDSDSPYCIVFGIFIIWFASLTINLGPTFLSGGLNSGDGHIDVCPMVYRPARHYVLNVLWIAVNLMCVSLMAIHLRKLYRDIVKSNFEAVRLASFVTTMIPVQNESSERNQKHLHGYIGRLELEGISRVKMFVVILVAYILFWGPLFLVTLFNLEPKNSSAYEVTLHIAFVHCAVNPILFLIMNRDAADGEEAQDNNREATADIRERPDQSCCRWDIDEEDEAASLPPAFPLPLDIPLSATCPGLGRSNGLSTSVTSLPGHSGHRYQHAQQHYAHNAHNGHRP